MRPVFTLWLGGPLTPLARASIRSFVNLGHPYTLYTYGKVGSVPPGAVLADAHRVLSRRKLAYLVSRHAYPMISNLFRYRRLLDGGTWVDGDVIALRPFDFGPEETIFAWQDGELMNGAVLGAPPDDPFIRELHRRATSWRSGYAWSALPKGAPRRGYLLPALRHGRTHLLAEAPWGSFGPVLITRTAENLGLARLARPPEVFYPVGWRDTERLLDTIEGWRGFGPETYAVHVWNSVLDRLGVRTPPHGSILQALMDGAEARPRRGAA